MARRYAPLPESGVRSLTGEIFKSFTDPHADLGYWLARCEGFRVEAPAGRLGTVSALRWESRADRPDRLVVRTGLLNRRELELQPAEIERIVPGQKLVVLKRDVV